MTAAQEPGFLPCFLSKAFPLSVVFFLLSGSFRSKSQSVMAVAENRPGGEGESRFWIRGARVNHSQHHPGAGGPRSLSGLPGGWRGAQGWNKHSSPPSARGWSTSPPLSRAQLRSFPPSAASHPPGKPQQRQLRTDRQPAQQGTSLAAERCRTCQGTPFCRQARAGPRRGAEPRSTLPAAPAALGKESQNKDDVSSDPGY